MTEEGIAYLYKAQGMELYGTGAEVAHLKFSNIDKRIGLRVAREIPHLLDVWRHPVVARRAHVRAEFPLSRRQSGRVSEERIRLAVLREQPCAHHAALHRIDYDAVRSSMQAGRQRALLQFASPAHLRRLRETDV